MHTRAREYIKEKRRRKPLQKKELAEMQKTQNL